jgi:hypothetical protein
MKPERKLAASEIFALAFGLFLGLAIWKFGNPVILDQKIPPPGSLSELWADFWPTHWANWILLPLTLIGAAIAIANPWRWPASQWLWRLPLLWFGWQLLSATQTVDAGLTATTLWQFFGCGACYFLGALVLGRERAPRWLLAGILAAFTFCLVRGIDQRLVEFPQGRELLLEGERTGWTNVPPEMFLQMKHDGLLITTNGAEMANPAILKKFAEGRVNGTLVYPNALAGLILLLAPVSLVLAFGGTKRLRPPIRAAVIALTLFLVGAGLFWTGSKLGWLIAMAVGGASLFRLNWPLKIKWAALAIILLAGLGIFAIRFQNYFAAGATSVGARFDYWRAAAHVTCEHPLTHNDYLEQFSDSGIAGGIFYAAWIFLSLTTMGRRAWKSGDPMTFAIFLGLLGWFAQGIGEFSLYIPALAWTAFALLGCVTPPSVALVSRDP